MEVASDQLTDVTISFSTHTKSQIADAELLHDAVFVQESFDRERELAAKKNCRILDVQNNDLMAMKAGRRIEDFERVQCSRRVESGGKAKLIEHPYLAAWLLGGCDGPGRLAKVMMSPHRTGARLNPRQVRS